MLKYGSTIEQLGPCGIQVEILSWVGEKENKIGEAYFGPSLRELFP